MKKDGSWKCAVDNRKLNQITIPISHPLPRIEDVFDALGESHATIFSTLDLNSAYFQIVLILKLNISLLLLLMRVSLSLPECRLAYAMCL